MGVQYFARAGRVHVAQAVPVALDKAQAIASVHRGNASYWLGRTDLSERARMGMAQIELELADEMEAAVAEVSMMARAA